MGEARRGGDLLEAEGWAMSIIDKVRDEKWLHWPRQQPILDNIRHKLSLAVVFNIDNVAKYVIEDNKQEEWERSDFPELALPFDVCWFEYSQPEYSNDNGKIVKQEAGIRIGDLAVLENGVVTVLRFVLAVGCQPFLIPFIHAWNTADNETGQAMAMACTEPVSEDVAREEVGKYEKAVGWGAMAPTYFAISLLHCKNVNAVDHEPSAQLNKKRIKRGHLPLMTFKTLEIGSMTRRLDAAKGESSDGVKQALHLCRGHFKTFDKRPLFGSIKGRFWWPAHARGDIENGMVAKNYALAGPEVTQP